MDSAYQTLDINSNFWHKKKQLQPSWWQITIYGSAAPALLNFK